MTGRIGNGLGRPHESFEVLLRQQHVLVAGRQNHALVADKQLRVGPLRNAAIGPDFRPRLSLVPRQGERRHLAARCILVDHLHRRRRDLRVRRAIGDRLHGERRSDVQGVKREIVPMAAEIAHRAVAEIPPAIPLRSGDVHRMKRPRGRGAEPQIPVQSRRHRHRFFRPLRDEHDVLVPRRRFLGLKAPRAIHPDVNFAHGTNRATLYELLDAAVVVGRMTLVAHLRGEFQLRCGFANQPRFRDVIRERLLAIDMLPGLQRQHRRKHVRVLTRADDDSVELFRVVEHLPEVGEPLRLRILCAAFLQRVGVDVAEGDDVLRCDASEIFGAAAAGANHRDVQLVVQVSPTQNRRRADRGSGSRESSAHKLPARDATMGLLCHTVLLLGRLHHGGRGGRGGRILLFDREVLKGARGVKTTGFSSCPPRPPW